MNDNAVPLVIHLTLTAVFLLCLHFWQREESQAMCEERDKRQPVAPPLTG